MKKLFALIFALLMLTACSKEPSAPEVVQPPVEQTVTEQPQEGTVPEVQPEIILPDAPEQTVIASPEAVSYTSELVEGLVEDAIGYSFEIPVFDLSCNDAIRPHYEQLVSSMISFTTEVVYTNAMERGCVVSVYGYVSEATVIDNVLAVTYVYECDYSDAEESTEETRIDRFDLLSGQIME